MKIENAFITASFQKQGAELISLKKGDQEYIWQADPAHWGRHTPVLFPFVGKLKNDQYQFNGTTYHSGQHGFARDMEFELVNQTENDITFELKSSAETLKKFPFEFELRISYHLQESAIVTTYEVFNASNTDMMFFSIGGHPAFNCPMDASEQRSDYWLRFNNTKALDAHLLEDGSFSGETVTYKLVDGKMSIADDLFDQDALVFKNLKADEITLESPKGKWLTFHFKGFPYLGIWSKSRTSPFVCIEPWFGLADHQNHDGELTEKEGILSLKPAHLFSTSYKIEFH